MTPKEPDVLVKIEFAAVSVEIGFLLVLQFATTVSDGFTFN